MNTAPILRKKKHNTSNIIIIIISIQHLGRFWQEPAPSPVTGMALACYILGKFLG
jgi:hypothetical protein